MNWSGSGGESGSGDYFDIPVAVDERKEVTLTLVDADGNTKKTARSVCVSDTVAPTVEILSPLSGAEFSGANTKLEVEIHDAVDQDISSYEVFIGRSLQGTLRDGHSVLKLSKDKDASGTALDITVKARDASGNLGGDATRVYQMHDSRTK